MAFRPAGAEDSGSDEDGFILSNDKYNPSDGGLTKDSRKRFFVMPAGAESDDDDGEDLDFGSVNLVSSQMEIRSVQKIEKQLGKTNGCFSKSGGSGLSKGRSVFQPKGRGLGRLPRQPPSFSNKGKTPERNNFLHSKPKQAETRKVQAPLVVDDFRVAVVKGNVTAVQKFLDNGIDPDILLKSGWTPLMLAASTASSEVIHLLIASGANVNFHKEMYTVLMATCAATGNVQEQQVLRCVELLLEKNARVNVYDKYRMSPLMYAAREGRVTVCKKLLDHSAEINKQDMRGWTSLSWAASCGHGKVVRILLDEGADPKIYSNDGQTPSDIAYSSEYPRIADILSLAAAGNQVTTDMESQLTRAVEKQESSSTVRYGDLEMFLCGLELMHLLPKFQEHNLTFEAFLKLTEKDLDQVNHGLVIIILGQSSSQAVILSVWEMQMGISEVGIRTKILDSIRDIHKKDWDMSSLQAMEKYSLRAPQVSAILANVSKHLAFVRSSVAYVQKHLETISEPLEFVQDVTEAEGMVLFSKEACDAAQSLHEEVDSLRTQICMINSKVSNTAPDLITDERRQSPQPSSLVGIMLMTGVAAVVIGSFLFQRAWHST